MTVISDPQPGTIVRVDLNEGFRRPEIRKRRPAIVLSPPLPSRQGLCTIVPISTDRPKPFCRHHLTLNMDPPLPEPFDSPVCWVKGDIVLTVAFHRLRLIFAEWQGGQRVYDVRVLDPDTFKAVQNCVRAGLGL